MKCFHLIFFIYLFLFVVNSFDQPLNSSDYGCLKYLLAKTNKLSDPTILKYWDDKSQMYDFCKLFQCSVDSTNNTQFYLQSISLKNVTTSGTISPVPTPGGPSSGGSTPTTDPISLIEIKYSDFQCFNRLNSIEITGYKVNSDIFMETIATSSVNSLSLLNCTTVKVPSNIQQNITSLTLELSESLFNTGGLISQSILLYLKTFILKSFQINPVGTFQYPSFLNNSISINKEIQMDNFIMTTNTIPDLTLFKITNVEIIVPYLNDISKLNSFLKVKILTLDFLSNTIDFPSLFTSTDNSLETIVLKSRISNLVQLIDLTKSKSLKSFKFVQKTNPPTPFVYGATASFPFGALPSSLEDISLENAGITTFNNQVDFKNTKKINLGLNKISGSLPAQINFPNLIQVSLKGNIYFGPIPNISYCNMIFDVSDNLKIDGELPQCFSCYIPTQPSLFQLFNGTQIKLDSIKQENCTLKAVPNFIIINSTNFQLSGDSLGYEVPFSYSDQFLANKQMVIPNKVFTGNILQNLDDVIIFKFMGANYTLQTKPISPNITQIYGATRGSSQNTYQFVGKYFTYNESILNITVNGYKCMVLSSAFELITCGLIDESERPILLKANSSIPYYVVYFSLSNFTTQLTVSSVSKISQVSLCKNTCNNGGICNTLVGSCVCLPTWIGNDCLTRDLDCPSNCTYPNGICNRSNGECSCSSKWNTSDCSNPVPSCPDTCNNGLCNNNTKKCECLPTWTGDDCLTRDFNCPNNCTYPNGDCNRLNGSCQCSGKWEASDCNTPIISCPDTCNNGMCNNNTKKCECLPTWTGDDCLTRDFDCPNNCTYPNGDCNRLTGSCTCKSNWQSIDCINPFKNCIGGCNEVESGSTCNNFTGECKCTSDYTGSNCLLPSQYISSIEPTTTDGGMVKIWGWFGKNNTDLTVQIGSLFCKVEIVNSSFISCEIGSDSGTKSVTIIQNNIKYVGNNIYHYTEITYKCPNDCSGHGSCNKFVGQCKCLNGWGGFDCNAISTTDTTPSSTATSTTTSQTQQPTSTPDKVAVPDTVTTVNKTEGSALINNEKTTYEIKIISLVELSFNQSIVKNNPLNNRWSVDTSMKNKFIFNQTLNNSNCEIIYSIEELKETRDYSFAGLDLTLDKGSIKISVEIKNYPYSNSLNTLQLQMESKIGEENSNVKDNNDECNKENTQIDTNQMDKNQVLNYVTISKDQKILYGRFINRVVSDTKPTFITTSIIQTNQSDSLIIGVNLPHCKQSCLIDPDFSVLVSSKYQQCSNDNNSNGKAPWILPVAIVVPCVTVAALIIIGSIVYRKNRTSILLAKEKYSFSLKKYSKKSNSDLYMPD
ncbi:hypothetical protein RB653_009109 [Dictyostelium firmibasis]|uniref:EGF-like domain-containing protein n=1 Tax=Dictyostelium firmibasis TaxID=79012 RepID=A0AAN7YUS2_9MYCE